MKKLAALLLALALLLSLGACAAKDAPYPSRSLTIIVPYSAGGSCDIVTRQFAALLERELGQSVTVLNQGGSSGTIGIQACLDAPADGYTLVMTADSLGTLRVMDLSDSLSYRDFTPICAVTSDPKVIVVAQDSPYEDLQQLLYDMRARPGRVKMSCTGPGGSGHIQSLILNALGCDMALTAYPGGSDCLLAVLNGSVDFTNANYSTVIDYLQAGTMRCLTVCGPERLAAMPDVPALPELCPEAADYLRFPFTPFVLQVSADVDEATVETLRAAARRALADEGWNENLAATCQDKLYEQYPLPEDVTGFLAGYESLVSWMLYDAGAAAHSPADFDIPRP